MDTFNPEIIEVGNEDVAGLLGLDIVAFQIAEGGAMGYHGGVFFVTSDRKAYSTCYLEPSAYTGFSKSMSWDNLGRVFPPLATMEHGLWTSGIRMLPGWQYSYLGMGNHLLVRNDVKRDFNKAAKKLLSDHPDTILYTQWLPAIISVL